MRVIFFRESEDVWKGIVWPTEVECRPAVGDYVEGHLPDSSLKPTMRVKKVIHTFDGLRVELEH